MNVKKIIWFIYKSILGEYKYAVKCGMTVGDNVRIMRRVKFGSEPYLITIGNCVLLSSDIRFITHDGGTSVFSHNNKKEDIVSFGKINVGENTFIGMGAIIMPNVTIGRNCVVGAGSVVTKDIPDGTVAAGVPARIICTVEEYRQKCIDKLPMNFDYEKYKKDKKHYLMEIL